MDDADLSTLMQLGHEAEHLLRQVAAAYLEWGCAPDVILSYLYSSDVRVWSSVEPPARLDLQTEILRVLTRAEVECIRHGQDYRDAEAEASSTASGGRCEPTPRGHEGHGGLLPDGPVQRKVFNWGGQSVRIEPRPWAILDFMWPGGRRRVKDVIAEVWGNDIPDEGAIKSALFRANDGLYKSGCPLKISRDGDELVLE
jgi:hypothetical protein